MSTAKNVSYIGASQLLVLVLNFVTLTVLANLLSTEDMGIIGVALVFLSLLYNIHDFGIMPAVIQRDTRVDESISSAISLRWIVSAVLLASVVATAPMLSEYLGVSDLTTVMLVLVSNLMILNFAFAPQARMTRGLRLSQLAVASAVQSVVLTAVVIWLAVFDYSYWSFVLGSVAGTAGYVICLNLYERTSHAPGKDFGLAKELLSYGKHLLATGLMVFLIFYVDQIAIAGVLGLASLGIYFVAVRFGRTIGEQIALTLNRVLFPTMARIKEDVELIKKGFVQSMRMISIVATPACFSLSALSPLVVRVLLGPEWIPAVFPLSVICFQGFVSAMLPPANSVIMAVGKPRYLTIQSSSQAVALIVLIYPVARYWGIDGVAVLTTALSLCFLGYLLTVVRSIFQSGMMNIMKPLVPSIASGTIMFILLAGLVILLPSNVIVLIGLVLLGLLVYVVTLYATSGGRDLRDAIELAKTMFSGQSSSKSTSE